MNQGHIKIKLKSNLKYELINYTLNIKEKLKLLNIDHTIFNMPTNKKVFTFLRSPHVYKKSKDQYSIKTFETTFYLQKTDKNLEFIKRFIVSNKPFGIKVNLSYKK